MLFGLSLAHGSNGGVTGGASAEVDAMSLRIVPIDPGRRCAGINSTCPAYALLVRRCREAWTGTRDHGVQ